MPPTTSDMGSVPINAPIPPITIDAGEELINGAGSVASDTGNFFITGGVTVVGGTEFSLRADSVSGNMKTGIATAEGHVVFRELNSYLFMDSLFASQVLKAGSAQNVQIYSRPYSISAERLSFEQNEVDLYSATLTTAPPGEKPDYTIKAQQITYLPLAHRIVVRNAAFYLGGTRLLEYRKATLRTGVTRNGEAATSSIIASSFGYNGFYGPFVVYKSRAGVPDDGVSGSVTVPARHGIGILLSATTPLITSRSNTVTVTPKTLIGRIRQAAEETEPILPRGDPLLFHWFQTTTAMNDRFLTIPNSLTLNTTATASIREPVYGHETDDLFYSRLPEASMTALAPISGPRSLPTSRDPQQMRNTLRQIALYAIVTPTIGRYYEYPDNESANREAAQFSIESRPILVADNVLFKPTITYTDATYPQKHQAFQVLQYDLAIEKYVNDRTGYGFEYLQSQEHGSSPFQFDTPYASKEFDSRLQVGLPHVILGAVFKYDIQDSNFYSEQIMIAPILKSLIPKFTYDFRDSSFGLGVDIEGLTY